LAKLIGYDNTGVETSQGGTGVKARPGVYVARVERCEQREKTRAGTPANDLEVALNVGEDFDWVFTYVNLGVDWKVAEFTRALGLPEKGRFDPGKQVGQLIRIKINPGTFEGSYSPDAGRMMKPLDEDEEPGPVSGIAEGNGEVPDEEAEEAVATAATAERYADGFEAAREGDEGIESYEEWSDEDLAAEVEDRGLTVPGGRGKKRDKLIAALRAEDEEVAGEGGSNGGAEATTDEYEEWSVDQLKEEWEAREMGDLPSIRGRNADTRLATAIVEALREDDKDNPFEP
jgi:hypothetical protein